ncbi:MAG: selenocysteine-specific translation elongation factor [Terriglobia bacterium]
MKSVVWGTAGHIDHGKSSLVLALTGTDPDRLEEEKRRGITIDLGFAHLDLGDGLQVAFVDVPGHERFIKNMLAGASGIDAVVLVVAADESIKPQTREHFEICKLLGIKRGLVAITKSDLADGDLVGLVRMEVQDFVAGSFLEGAPILPVSARSRTGLTELKSELARLSLGINPKPRELPFRLPIDRSFVMKGFGAVVTGTLAGGEIKIEDEVVIHPVGKKARVRSIQIHNQSTEVATAGQRTALNLAGVEASEVRRGMALAPPDLFQPTRRLDGSLMLLPSARPLKSHAKIHFHCGTSELLADAVLLSGEKELKPGDAAFAQLRLSEPGLFLPGDHFIIRQFSPVMTIGGGVVLDNLAPRHKLHDVETLIFLRALEGAGAEARIELLVRRAGEISLASLAARTGLKPAEVARAVKLLEDRQQLVPLGQPPMAALDATFFEMLKQEILESLTAFHRANPLVAGMAREQLRGQLKLRAPWSGLQPSPLAFSAASQSLSAAAKIMAREDTVTLAGKSIQLNAEEARAKDEILRSFEAAGLRAPPTAEVLGSLKIDRPRAEKILQMLLKEKALIRVTEGLIFHHSALEEVRGLLQKRKMQTQRLDVASFKQMTGVSRKYAIPLLEFLDRERITRRVGDERIIL